MKQKIVKLSVLILVFIFFTKCEKQTRLTQITLTNNSSINLKDKPITILKSQLNYNQFDSLFPLLISSKGDTIPSQLDDLDGDDSWDELFFVIDLIATHFEYTLL